MVRRVDNVSTQRRSRRKNQLKHKGRSHRRIRKISNKRKQRITQRRKQRITQRRKQRITQIRKKNNRKQIKRTKRLKKYNIRRRSRSRRGGSPRFPNFLRRRAVAPDTAPDTAREIEWAPDTDAGIEVARAQIYEADLVLEEREKAKASIVEWCNINNLLCNYNDQGTDKALSMRFREILINRISNRLIEIQINPNDWVAYMENMRKDGTLQKFIDECSMIDGKVINTVVTTWDIPKEDTGLVPLFTTNAEGLTAI